MSRLIQHVMTYVQHKRAIGSLGRLSKYQMNSTAVDYLLRILEPEWSALLL